MTGQIDIRSPEPVPRPGKPTGGRGIAKEAEGSYFTLDPDAGTITWTQYGKGQTTLRLPGRREPSSYPELAKLVEVTMPQIGTWFIFVGTDGQCLHRAGLWNARMLRELWPPTTLEQLQPFGLPVEASTAANFHDLNRQYPGASAHWWARSPALMTAVILPALVIAAIIAILLIA